MALMGKYEDNGESSLLGFQFFRFSEVYIQYKFFLIDLKVPFLGLEEILILGRLNFFFFWFF